MQDDDTGDLIIKMANLLPVEINAKMDLSAYDLDEMGMLTVLQGENARPAQEDIVVSEKLLFEVPRYSFNLIKVKTK